MKKRLISALLVFVFTVALMPLSVAEATDTVGRKTYDEVIKCKNTVYCSTYSGIYKVKLKNNKPVKKTRLVKFSSGCGAMYMIKKGKYIYYLRVGTAAGGNVYRVNVNNGKKKKLTGYLDEGNYTIVNNKLYYSKIVWDCDESCDYCYEDYHCHEKGYCANLNGTSRLSADIAIKNTGKKTNSKSYRVKYKYKGNYQYDYIKTPKGRFYLGKRKI